MVKKKKEIFFKTKFTKAEEREEIRRMFAGLPHISWVPSLFKARKRAKMLTYRYNRTSPNQKKLRKDILKKLFGKTGSWIMVEPPFNCDYGSNIIAENFVYMNSGCCILDCNKVYIGKNVMFGPGVQVYAVNHPLDPKERLTYKEIALPVKIGDNAWIGGGAIILPGVTIGKNTTIGAGAVVTKDIPANVFAAGNPCKVIRKLKVSA
jgi:maltose O-acetyltransferase